MVRLNQLARLKVDREKLIPRPAGNREPGPHRGRYPTPELGILEVRAMALALSKGPYNRELGIIEIKKARRNGPGQYPQRVIVRCFHALKDAVLSVARSP